MKNIPQEAVSKKVVRIGLKNMLQEEVSRRRLQEGGFKKEVRKDVRTKGASETPFLEKTHVFLGKEY